MLEVLLALSQRVSFESNEAPEFWFWKFLENLDLRQYTDEVYQQGDWANIDEIINTLVGRTYKANGLGGLFPLQNARANQKRVEIWYQMSAYLLENGYVT